MAIAMQLDGLRRSPARRAVAIFLSLWTLLAVSAAPVFAGYEWCSQDPEFTFQREGTLLPGHVLDVQVQVLGVVSSDTATLALKVPSNVAAQETLPLSTVFKLDTTIDQVLDPAASEAYSIQLASFFPSTSGELPARLVVTDPSSATSVACAGNTGQTIRARVQFQPFSVSCQNDQFMLYVPVMISSGT